MPKSFVQEAEAGSLGTTDVLSDLFQVLAMKRDEIAEELDVAGFARRCRILAIDPPLDIDAPFLRILSAEKCIVDIFPLSSDWTLQEPYFSLVIAVPNAVPRRRRALASDGISISPCVGGCGLS